MLWETPNDSKGDASKMSFEYCCLLVSDVLYSCRRVVMFEKKYSCLHLQGIWYDSCTGNDTGGKQ